MILTRSCKVSIKLCSRECENDSFCELFIFLTSLWFIFNATTFISIPHKPYNILSFSVFPKLHDTVHSCPSANSLLYFFSLCLKPICSLKLWSIFLLLAKKQLLFPLLHLFDNSKCTFTLTISALVHDFMQILSLS